MDLKREVRRRIAELTRFAYERGYREGAQSALAEIENVAGEDLADQLQETSAPIQAVAKAAAPEVHRRAAVRKQKVRPRTAKSKAAAPKAVTVQRCIQGLVASKGEARRAEVLAAARAENPEITSKDVHNGIRTLTRQSEIRIDPKEKSRLLPSEPRSEQPSAS